MRNGYTSVEAGMNARPACIENDATSRPRTGRAWR